MRPILARLCLPAFTTLIVLASSLFPAGAVQAQLPTAPQLEDVVYLKDGSIIRGILMEQRPGESVLIRTRDGNQFRYQMSQIEKLTKEAPVWAAVPKPEGLLVPAATVVRANPKSPGLAAFLSLILPGAGQAYNGDWFGAVIFFTTTVYSLNEYATAMVSDACVFDARCGSAGGWAIAFSAIYVWGIFDAGFTANGINRSAARSALLSVRPWIDVAHATAIRGNSLSASRTGSRPAASRLQLGLLRLTW